MFSAIRIRHVSNAVFLLPLVLRGSLTVQMCFDLVHRRLYLVVGNQINKSVRLKIGDTDGADNAFFVSGSKSLHAA